MAFDALAIANYFLDKARDEGKRLDPMALQKLVYFAHGWHLAVFNQPLIQQRVEAWDYGPVIRDIYREFKEFGKSPITRKANRWELDDFGEVNLDRIKSVEPQFVATPETSQTKALLDRVWDVYKRFSGVQLSNLTHTDKSPWCQTREENPAGAPGRVIINDSLIREWFQSQATRNAAKREQPA